MRHIGRIGRTMLPGALFFGIIGLFGATRVFGQASDLRATRETLTIQFTGDAAQQSGELERDLKETLTGRFDIVASPPAVGRLVVQIQYEDKERKNVGYLAYFTYHDRAPVQLTLLGIYVADEIAREIAKRFPLTSRVVSLVGNTAVVDMGSNVGIKHGSKLQVYDNNDARCGLLRVRSVGEIESETKVIRGDCRLGYRVSPQLPLRGGLGVEYTHFRIGENPSTSTGRRIVLMYQGSKDGTGGGWAQMGTGYIDFGGIKGWYVAGINIILQDELLPDLLFFQAGGGGGLSLVDWRKRAVKDSDSTTLSPLGVWNYEATGGFRLHFTRELSLSLKAGVLGYTRYETPEFPVFTFALNWLGT